MPINNDQLAKEYRKWHEAWRTELALLPMLPKGSMQARNCQQRLTYAVRQLERIERLTQ